ncbi:hypothetical protein ACA910_007479 [Epithemia clementina (nom. ined.)]
MSAHFLQYRAAIALNNMATTLMRKGYFEMALSTLCDALKIIQKTAPSKDEDGTHATTTRSEQREVGRKRRRRRRSASRTSPETIFDAASKRFSRVFHPTTVLSLSKGATILSEIEVDVLDDNDISGLQAAVRYGQSFAVVFPVRIVSYASWSWAAGRTHDEFVSTSRNVLAKQLGIILYNHGLAAFLVVRLRTTTTEQHFLWPPSLSSVLASGATHDVSLTGQRRRYMKNSQTSLRMAETTFSSSLLVQRQQDETDHSHCLSTGTIGSEQEYSVILLVAMTLQLQSSVFYVQGRTFEAHEAQDTVSLLFATIVHDHVFWVSLLAAVHPCAPLA